MWISQSEKFNGDRALKVAILLSSVPVPYGEVLRRWQLDENFRAFFISILADSPFAAFRWETPPLTSASADRPFEFVLLDSPSLDRTPSPDAFAEYFHGAPTGGIVEFTNLGGDAILIAPCSTDLVAAYGHIGAFIRQAPERQKHDLWKCVGAAMQQRTSNTPIWLSTAGAGVPWLHVRLDRRPKYYGHAPYRDVP